MPESSSVPPSPEPPRPRPERGVWWPVLVSFLVAWALGVWKNDFPFYWHVDEPGKARQLLTGERNLHHPLLMLTSAQVAVKALGTPPEPQAVVEVGRHVSATFNALAVALLAGMLGRAFAPGAAWIGGLLAATHWNIFELSHYFKEDPALAFGLMAALAALGGWRRRPGPLTGAFFGAGLALAVSGKYVGVIALLLLPLAWWRHPPPHGRRAVSLLALAGAFVAVFAAINAAMFLHPEILQASLKKETTGVLEGGPVATHHGFHFGFFKRFGQVTKIALWPGLLFFLLFSLRHARRWPVEITALLALPLVFAVMLGFSQMDSGRYYLPAVFGCCALAAVGWHDWLAWSRQAARPRVAWIRAATVVAALVTIGGAAERLSVYGRGLNEATRASLTFWIALHLPPSAVIAQSEETKLPDATFPGRESVANLFPQRLVTLEKLARHLTLDDLRSRGITHLAAAESEWRPYLKTGRVRAAAKKDYEQQRAFWQALDRDARVVWECGAGKIGTHNPPLKLWELAPPAAP